MDKHKLIRIIVNDLEELKFLSEEIAENEGDSSLIIDLALSKARLLCQEIEVLKELSVPHGQLQEDNEKDMYVALDDHDIQDSSFSDPELEILHFEDREIQEEEEIAEAEPGEEEAGVEENEEFEPEEELAEENAEDMELPQDEELNEDIRDEDEEEEDEYIEEDELDKGIEEESEEEKEVEVREAESKQVPEFTSDPKSEMREINIDDPDDDIETIQFAPHGSNAGRSVMHEIPKPENLNPGKIVVGETFQKERSVNEVIGDNKSNESKLTNGPISSLRAAIGLNDRFLFIREIFENNTEKYNTIIDYLDKLETIQQAVEYLKANLSLQKNDTSIKFVDLLKRRFSK